MVDNDMPSAPHVTALLRGRCAASLTSWTLGAEDPSSCCRKFGAASVFTNGESHDNANRSASAKDRG